MGTFLSPSAPSASSSTHGSSSVPPGAADNDGFSCLQRPHNLRLIHHTAPGAEHPVSRLDSAPQFHEPQNASFRFPQGGILGIKRLNETVIQ